MRVVFYPHPEASEELIDNVPVNQRQQWFINQIQRNVKVSAKDIAGYWKVSEKTAKRYRMNFVTQLLQTPATSARSIVLTPLSIMNTSYEKRR
jgi:hypothetical protein